MPVDGGQAADAGAVEAVVRRIVAERAGLVVTASDLGPETDLYRAGLTSHASINLMLALEAEFDVEFPQEMLRKATFQSVRAITGALVALLGAQPPGAPGPPGAWAGSRHRY